MFKIQRALAHESQTSSWCAVQGLMVAPWLLYQLKCNKSSKFLSILSKPVSLTTGAVYMIGFAYYYHAIGIKLLHFVFCLDVGVVDYVDSYSGHQCEI